MHAHHQQQLTHLITFLLPTSDLSSLHCRSFAETLSTLKFAQRAKMIRNAAKPNEVVTGTAIEAQIPLTHLLPPEEGSSQPPRASA